MDNIYNNLLLFLFVSLCYNYRYFDIKWIIKYIAFYFYKSTKKGKMDIKIKQLESMKAIKEMFFNKKYLYNFDELPRNSINQTEIIKVIDERRGLNNNKISGCVYINDSECKNLMQKISQYYLFSNPLHPDIYPELLKMESEIIKMVGSLYELPESGGGNLTTGGTESTILALKAYKKMKRKTLYFFKPEVLCTKTVHAAVHKACELLDLKIVYVDLNDDYVMDVNDLKNKISFRTCVIIASAPCFAYGLMDPIIKISDIANFYSIPLHVDACLGGFICQFNKKLRLTFKCNIQSISIDPHKFGYAPKGSSILLWKNKKMRHNQYFVVNDWTGGIYASVSLPGSRVGNQIATTWGALLFNGINGYEKYSKNIIESTIFLKNEINKLNTFHVIGNPNINVVAFYSDVYSVGDLLENFKKHNWNLNILQYPTCLHICITPKNMNYIKEVPNILCEMFNKKTNENKNTGIASIYGMSAQIPDKSIINDIIYYYLDYTTNC